MFYEFRQNNSGGGFEFSAESGITHFVIIEAEDHEEANSIAQSIGIYFDGIDSGIDCNCCGDRWHSAWYSDGTEEPRLYGEVVEDDWKCHYRWMGNDPELFIHYSDGRIVPIMG